VKFLQST